MRMSASKECGGIGTKTIKSVTLSQNYFHSNMKTFRIFKKNRFFLVCMIN